MKDQPPGDPPRVGSLPNRPPDRIWRSNGTGRACQLCGKEITRLEIQLELEFVGDGPHGDGVLHFAHRACFDALGSDGSSQPKTS